MLAQHTSQSKKNKKLLLCKRRDIFSPFIILSQDLQGVQPGEGHQLAAPDLRAQALLYGRLGEAQARLLGRAVGAVVAVPLVDGDALVHGPQGDPIGAVVHARVAVKPLPQPLIRRLDGHDLVVAVPQQGQGVLHQPAGGVGGDGGLGPRGVGVRGVVLDRAGLLRFGFDPDVLTALGVYAYQRVGPGPGPGLQLARLELVVVGQHPPERVVVLRLQAFIVRLRAVGPLL